MSLAKIESDIGIANRRRMLNKLTAQAASPRSTTADRMPDTYIHTYIHKLYLSSDFSVAYIASISDPNLLI